MNSNSKTFGIFALSLLAISLTISFAAALAPSLTFSYGNQSQTLSVPGFNVSNSNISFPSTVSGLLGNQNFATFTIANTSSSSLKILLSNLDSSNNYYGNTGSVTFNVTNNVNQNKSAVTLNYVRSFCDYGDLNDSNLEMSVSVTNGGSGDANSWNPLDTISVEVTVYNNNNYDINNVMLEMGLFKKGTNSNIVNNLDWLTGDNQKVSIGDLPSGDSQTYTFKFKVDPKIISTRGSGNYLMMLKAYPESKENQVCIDHSSDLSTSFGGVHSYADSISISSPGYSGAVVIDPSSLSALTTVSCGQQLVLNPTIYNIGSSGNSYSKNQITVVAKNANLGMDKNITLYGDLSAGNSEQAPITFTIPRNADEGNYPISLQVLYGYNENSGGYAGNYRYISQVYNSIVQVKGSCVYATPATTQIQAQLQSGGNAGQPLVVQATITNMGSRTVNYNFGVEGYTSWSRLLSITPMNVTLKPGQSQAVTLNLTVNSDASGNKQFYFDTYSNGFLITQQPLSVTIKPKFSLASITGNAINGSNWFLWSFNVLLVIAIIVVLVIVLRKRS